MTLGGQFRTSVRSIRAVGVSPKALSGGGAGAHPGLLDVRQMSVRCPSRLAKEPQEAKKH